MNVVIGTPVCRNGAYVIDKFLSNQLEIQRAYRASELVFATSENDFFEELDGLIRSSQLRATVLHHDTVKPDHARSNLWDIACSRDAIRKYALSQTQARYVLFLDADMTFEPSVIATMEREIQGYDAIFSGYPLRRSGIGLAGAGCVMLTRSILERIKFRCYEFENGEIIFEDNVLEMDLFHLGSRVKKGFFVAISHYTSPTEASHVVPQPLGLARRLVNSALVRYALLRASVIIHRNIPWKLKILLNKFVSPLL